MGQSLPKLNRGSETKLAKLVEDTAKKYHEERFKDVSTKEEFYLAVCETVEWINTNCGNTQFRVPEKHKLEEAFNKHHRREGEGKLTRDEFQKILQDVITDTGFTGFGAKYILLYIFGVPVTALLAKQGLMLKAIPNAVFIPAVTSATVFVLATLNKL